MLTVLTVLTVLNAVAAVVPVAPAAHARRKLLRDRPRVVTREVYATSSAVPARRRLDRFRSAPIAALAGANLLVAQG